jgi:hypothetical protein
MKTNGILEKRSNLEGSNVNISARAASLAFSILAVIVCVPSNAGTPNQSSSGPQILGQTGSGVNALGQTGSGAQVFGQTGSGVNALGQTGTGARVVGQTGSGALAM